MVKPLITIFEDMFTAKAPSEHCYYPGHHARELLKTCAAIVRGSQSGFTWKDASCSHLDDRRTSEALKPYLEGLNVAASMVYEGESSVLLPWKNHWLLGLSLSVTDGAVSPVAFITFEGKTMPRFDSHMRGVIDGFRCSLATILNCERIEEASCRSSDLLVVCSHCKLIKGEKNQWLPWDSYPMFNGRQKLSHTICEACSISLYDVALCEER